MRYRSVKNIPLTQQDINELIKQDKKAWNAELRELRAANKKKMDKHAQRVYEFLDKIDGLSFK